MKLRPIGHGKKSTTGAEDLQPGRMLRAETIKGKGGHIY